MFIASRISPCSIIYCILDSTEWYFLMLQPFCTLFSFETILKLRVWFQFRKKINLSWNDICVCYVYIWNIPPRYTMVYKMYTLVPTTLRKLGLSPTKSILCVYVYKMYTFCGVFWLWNLLVYLLFFLCEVYLLYTSSCSKLLIQKVYMKCILKVYT